MKKSLLLALLLALSGVVLAQTAPNNDILINKGPVKTRTCAVQDYDRDGDLDIVAIEEANTLISNSQTQLMLYENEPTRQFPKRVLIGKDIVRPRHLMIADFNKDGLDDYLVSMRSGSGVTNDGELAWFQRQASGTYIKWTIAASSDFAMADTSDFNKDGLVDVVAVGFDRKVVSVFMNDGQFFTEKVIKTGVTQVDLVKAGDLDKDGDADIVFTDGNSNFNLIFNDGKANFSGDRNLQKPFERFGQSGLAIADINKDGINDILTYDSYGFSDLIWLDGAKNWESKIILGSDLLLRPLGGNIQTVDLNKDGLLDIFTHDYSSDIVLAIYQKPGLKFDHKIIDRFWDNAAGPGQIAIGDMDNDQDPDIVFAENGNVDLDFSWYENIRGDLFRHNLYGEYDKITVCKATDVDKDGDQDLVFSCSGDQNFGENELVLAQNIGNGRFVDWVVHDLLIGVRDVEAGDLDGDGDPDLAVAVTGESDLVVLTNEGRYALWKTDTIDANINQITGTALADLDKDGKLDIIACANGDAKVFWYRNLGNNRFQKRVVDADLKKPLDAETADFDGDGDLDMAVVAQDTTGYLTFYTNDGTGAFIKGRQFRGFFGTDIEIGDPNRDNRPDVLVSATPMGSARGEVRYAINLSSGFAVTRLLTATNNQAILSLRYADINNDNEADLIYGFDDPGYSNRPIEAAIYKQGKIDHTARMTRFGRGEITSIDVADLNKDGIQEVVHTDFLFGDLITTNYPCFRVTPVRLGNDTVIRPNTSITLSVPAVSGYSYRWSTGATTNSLSVRMPGTYILTITNDYGCPASDTVVVRAFSSVVTLESLGIRCFPNPTTGLIYLQSDQGDFDDGLLTVFNVLGQPVRTVRIQKTSSVAVDLSGLPVGAYVLAYRGGKWVFSVGVVRG